MKGHLGALVTIRTSALTQIVRVDVIEEDKCVEKGERRKNEY